MKKFARLFPAAVFFLLIFFIAIDGIVQEDKLYSDSENRILQSFPKVSEKRILNGKFQKKYEKYLSDQFPMRDRWVELQTYANIALGRREANGVYFGGDGYLLEHHTKNDFKEKQVKKNIKALGDFVREAQKTATVKVMMAPSKTFVLKEKLPPFAESYDESIFYDMLKEAIPKNSFVDVYPVLRGHADEYIYYRTDHHWTTFGAWYGYRAYMESIEEKHDAKDAIKEKKKRISAAADGFLGTTHSRVNTRAKADTVYIYNPPPGAGVKVVYNLGEKKTSSYYQMDFLKKKDKYGVFFGGNQGLLEISSGNKNGKKLLVIKDSFANCMIPFLADDFEKTTVADLRQLNVNMSALLDMFRPTDVLVLYNVEQFMNDKEFALK